MFDNLVVDETRKLVESLRREGDVERVLSAFEDSIRQCTEAFPPRKSFLLAILDVYDSSIESPLLKVHRQYIERREQYLRQLMEPTLQAYRK